MTSQNDIESGGQDALTPAAPTTGENGTERAVPSVGATSPEDEEKKAYRSLMHLLDKVEDRNLKATVVKVVLELLVISGLTAAMACTLTLERMKHQRLLGLRMWQYVMMAMVVFAGLSIIRYVTAGVFWAARCCWWLHRDLGDFLRQIKTTVDVTLWLCAILFAWYVWFRPRLKHVYGDISVVAAHQITRFLIAVCLGSVLWVGKNALYLWLEADLHYRQLCDRITRTILQLHVLQILHTYGMWKFLTNVTDRKKLIQQTLDDKESTEAQDGEENPWMKGHNICKELLWVKRDTVPVWIMRRLCEEYKNQVKLKPLPVTKETVQDPEKLMDEALELFRRMKRNPNNKNPDQPRTNMNSADVSPESDDDDDDDDDEVKITDLKGKYRVEREELELFFRRFPGVKCDNENRQNDQEFYASELPSIPLGRAHVNCSCLGCNMKESETDHGNAYDIDKAHEDWRIGRDEFCSWAVQAYRNCWGLQSTLKSSEQIIVKLNRMMVAFVLLLALIIWLLLSEIVDSAQIALLFSPLLAAKFIFSESTKNMFDGLIFALAMHPFNPGDRVIIQEMELLVTEINILSTTFYKYQTGEELVYPNSALATTQITNLEFIPDQTDQLEFSIINTTPLEDIRDLELTIQMSLDERKDAFKTKVVKTEMGSDNIKMTVRFNYVGSYLTSELKEVHKSDMMSLIMRLRKKIELSKKEAAPLTCKPYFVDVTLGKKVKLKQIENIIKVAIESSLDEHYKGHERYKDHVYKVVMNNVSDKKVRIAFYVWKESSEDPNDEKGEHELISKQDLDHIRNSVFNRIQNPNGECTQAGSNGEGGHDGSSSGNGEHVVGSIGGGGAKSVSKPGLKVIEVKIQLEGTVEMIEPIKPLE